MKWAGLSLFLLISLCLPKETLSTEDILTEDIVTVGILKGIIEKSVLRSAKATFDLTLYKDGEPRGEFQGVTAFKAPDKISMKLFGPLGLTVFDLIGKDGIMQIYVPPKDELYQGDIPKDLSLIFGISDDSQQYAMEETEDSYIFYLLRLDRNSLSLRAKFFFDKKGLKNRRIDILNGGRSQFRIEFRSFKDDFPMEATLFLQKGFSMIIKNKEVILNEVPPDELFSFKDTEGKEVKDITRILEKKSDKPF